MTKHFVNKSHNMKLQFKKIGIRQVGKMTEFMRFSDEQLWWQMYEYYSYLSTDALIFPTLVRIE